MSFWNVFSGKSKSPQELVAAGEYKAALKGLLAKVTAKKFDPVLMIQIADVYRKMNKNIEAKRYYVRVGEYYGERGFFNKAVAVFKKALNITPNDREILSKLANYNNKVPKYMLDSQFLRRAGHKFLPVEPNGATQEQGSAEADDATSASHEDEPREAIDINFEEIAEPSEVEDYLPEDFAAIGVEDTIQNTGKDAGKATTTTASGAVFSSSGPESELNENPALDFSSLDDALNALFSSESDVSEQSKAENRKHWALFRAMPNDVFMDFVTILESREFGGGSPIVEQGQHGDEMFLITEGEVEVVLTENDETKRLATLGEGDFFGEASLLTGEPRNATVRTLNPTSCLVLDQSHLRELSKSHPTVLEAIETSYRARMRQRALNPDQGA